MSNRPGLARVLYLALIGAVLVAGINFSTPRWGPLLFGSTASNPPAAADLPGREVPMMDSPHVTYLGAPHQPYNSVPPTSGPHLSWPAAPGIYREPVADELTVHALEHGHVAILYAPDTPADQVDALERLARRFTGQVVLAPHPAVRRGVALTAWCRLQRLDSVDLAAIRHFVEELSGRYVHGWVR